jgi:peptide/nickel transport system ATP-binding protein
MNELLEVSHLTTVFSTDKGLFTAVDDISFALCKGEILGIVGESGSGKSVTSLSIMQLIKSPGGKIASGNIIYNGSGVPLDILTLPEKEKRKFRGKEVAMIFQEPMTSLNPVITCGKQVSEAIQLHLGLQRKEAKKRTIELFEKVQLPRPDSIYNSYPHQLSGGQKQRVMIAMAISCNPKILIADEPTTALDVTVQATILQLLKQLQSETGMSIIFITHDLGVISNLADRVMVMYKGKVVEEGAISKVFSSPSHPYTKGLLACRPSLNSHLSRLPVISDFMDTDDAGVITEKKFIPGEHRNKSHAEDNGAAGNNKQSKLPLISVNNLSVHYPVKNGFFGKAKSVIKAVDDVSFDIYKGEVLGLVGESGCGKTTLGRAVLNLVQTTAGKVMYEGLNITDLRTRDMRPLRKNLQIIFQDPYSSLNPRITVGEAILEPMKVHDLYNNEKERRERVMWLLKKVDLREEHYRRYPHEFSGGQRQRVGIARALALNPEFIICDESVSALDVSVQAQVLNLLNELKSEFNFTYIFISHDLSVVKFMSDRLMVMYQGKIVERGNADEIYRNPQSEYTKKLIDSIPDIKV